MNNAEIAQVIRDAVAVIERDGWCQNSYMSVEGQKCMSGAVAQAVGCLETGGGFGWIAYTSEKVPKWDVVVDVLCDYLADDISIPMWNDQPGRSEEDVKKFMLGVADKIEVE